MCLNGQRAPACPKDREAAPDRRRLALLRDPATAETIRELESAVGPPAAVHRFDVVDRLLRARDRRAVSATVARPEVERVDADARVVPFDSSAQAGFGVTRARSRPVRAGRPRGRPGGRRGRDARAARLGRRRGRAARRARAGRTPLVVDSAPPGVTFTVAPARGRRLTVTVHATRPARSGPSCAWRGGRGCARPGSRRAPPSSARPAPLGCACAPPGRRATACDSVRSLRAVLVVIATDAAGNERRVERAVRLRR